MKYEYIHFRDEKDQRFVSVVSFPFFSTSYIQDTFANDNEYIIYFFYEKHNLITINLSKINKFFL